MMSLNRRIKRQEILVQCPAPTERTVQCPLPDKNIEILTLPRSKKPGIIIQQGAILILRNQYFDHYEPHPPSL